VIDTLSYHKKRPFTSAIDLSGASLMYVVNGYEDMQAMLVRGEGVVSASPESEALWFYLQNHAMHIISSSLDKEEPLGDYEMFVNQYHRDMQPKALRMFYYLLLICTRETRHAKEEDEDEDSSGLKKLYKKYPKIKEFHYEHIKDTSAAESIKAMLDQAPDVTLGEYTDFLVDAFQFPSYGGAFGGEAWEAIARPLRDFVHGIITAEILMDTAFTLAHNTGPIFNKGMVFTHYDEGCLNRILDVQSSGQIPQLIGSMDAHIINFISDSMNMYVLDFSKLVGTPFLGSVDWTRVESISGGTDYLKEIAGQVKKTKGNIISMLKKKAKVVSKKLAKEFKNKNSIEIMPGVFVLKGKRSVVND